MAKRVSSIYGNALFDLAKEENRVDAFFEEIQQLKQILTENQELLVLLNHPEIRKREKIDLVQAIFSRRVSEEVLGFLCIIVEKDRHRDLPEILDHLIGQMKQYKKIGTATVISAIELTARQKKKLETRLLETTSYRSFEMDYQVDPAILGGLIIRIGNRVLDSSLKTQIDRLSRQLSNIPLYEGGVGID